MSDVAIRRAQAEDAGRVRDLTRRAYAKWVPVVGREPRPMTADHAHAVRAHLVALAERNGVLLALVECIPAPDHLLIENLAVDPAAQGQGLGRRLLDHAEDLARDLGLTQMRLYTNKAFETNVALYLRRGYRVTQETPLPDGGVMVDMAKPLN